MTDTVPAMQALTEVTHIYGWRAKDGTVYSGDGYPVPLRRFVLDNDHCVALLVAAEQSRASTPAVDREARDWVNSIPGVKPTDQFIALDRRLFEDCIERAILALHPPVMGEAEAENARLREFYDAVEGCVCTWAGSDHPSSFYPNGGDDCDDDEDQDRWDRFVAARRALRATLSTKEVR